MALDETILRLKLSGQYRHRGQYRFWDPIDYRYEYYSWPKHIVVKCENCSERFDFEVIIPEQFAKDEESGGLRLIVRPIGGEIAGRGACPNCGRQYSKTLWPKDAYYQFEIGREIVWAWNEKYIRVLRARVSGDRALGRIRNSVCEVG